MRAARDALLKCMDSISVAYSQPDILEEDSSVHEVDGKLEESNLSMMKKVSQVILDLKAEVSSIVSRLSQMSTRSRTASSVISRADSITLKREAATKAADLQTKLKYMDAESAKKEELEQIQTRKELDMAEAYLEIMKSEEATWCEGSSSH